MKQRMEKQKSFKNNMDSGIYDRPPGVAVANIDLKYHSVQQENGRRKEQEKLRKEVKGGNKNEYWDHSCHIKDNM